MNLSVSQNQNQNFENNFDTSLKHQCFKMQPSYSTPIKEIQPNKQLAKSNNQTRQGDWVCLNCNNLNFSFRKKCNRCKTQTRKQNQELQNAYTLYFYQQHQANLYNYENQHLYQNPVNSDPIYYIADVQPEAERKNSTNSDMDDYTLSFSKQKHNNQMIEININSPSKENLKENIIQAKKNDRVSKKLRTPSSKKKKTHKKKHDLLPSVSPLLKKLLAKQDTATKNSLSITKDPLNMALFYDEVWDNNRENLVIQSSSMVGKESHLYLSNSAKKILGNSRMHKTNDSFDKNSFEDDGFQLFMRSPQKEYDDEIIEIDEGDEELAQIINRIII